MTFVVTMAWVAALVLWLPLLIGLAAQMFFSVPKPGEGQDDGTIVMNEPPEGDPHWQALLDAPGPRVRPGKTTTA